MHALKKAPEHTAAATSPELVQDDELVEVIEVLGALDVQLRAHATRPRRPDDAGQDASLVRLAVQLQGQGLLLVPLVRVGHDLLLHERPHLGAVLHVALGVVRRVELGVPPGLLDGEVESDGARQHRKPRKKQQREIGAPGKRARGGEGYEVRTSPKGTPSPKGSAVRIADISLAVSVLREGLWVA